MPFGSTCNVVIVSDRWWTKPFGLPPKADKGSAPLTDRQVKWFRANLVLIPLLVIVAAAVTGKWYLLLIALSPFYNLFVIQPPSDRKKILGLR